MQKTTFLLPEPVWRQLKIRAMDEHTSLRRIVLDAVLAYLKTPPTPKAKTQKKETT
jgi:hypothetical protein